MQRSASMFAGGVLLPVLVAFSMRGPVESVLAVAVAVGATLLVWLGPTRMGTGCILLGMFLAPQDGLRPGSASSIVTFSDLFIVLGLGLLLPQLLTHHRTHAPLLFAVGAIWVTVSSLVASALASEPGSSLLISGRFIAAAVLLPTAFLLWRPNFRTVDRLAWAYVAGQVLSTIWALIGGPVENGRYEGTSTHANFFALSGLLASVLLIHLYHRTPARHRWLVWASAAVCLYSISMSGSRGALLSIIMIAMLYPLLERSIMSAYLSIAAVVCMVPAMNWLIGALSAENSAIARLFGDDSTTYADDSRRTALDAGFRRFLDSPVLGSGFNDILVPHNIYLQVAVAIGVIGLLGWILMMMPFVTPLVSNHPLRRLSYVTLAYFAIGMTQPSMWDRVVWVALCLALLAAVPYEHESADETDRATSEVS